MDIRFCDQCDASIPEDDVDRGVATRLEGRLLCSRCLPRAKRQRVLSFLIQPLALLAAAGLGAAGAVWLLSPQIVELNTRVSALAARTQDRPAVDPSVVDALDRLGTLGRSLAQANEDLQSASAKRDQEMGAVINDCQTRMVDLAAEVREIREFLAAAAADQPAEAPEPTPAPGDADAEEPAAAPAVDVETWLPFAADPDAGVRLSALVALEPSRDPRVLLAAQAALIDSDAVVRAQAARMLADRDDQESVPALIDLLLDRNARVRVVAHRALETLTGLELSFDSADSEDTRKGAVKAIRELLGE